MLNEHWKLGHYRRRVNHRITPNPNPHGPAISIPVRILLNTHVHTVTTLCDCVGLDIARPPFWFSLSYMSRTSSHITNIWIFILSDM